MYHCNSGLPRSVAYQGEAKSGTHLHPVGVPPFVFDHWSHSQLYDPLDGLFFRPCKLHKGYSYRILYVPQVRPVSTLRPFARNGLVQLYNGSLSNLLFHYAAARSFVPPKPARTARCITHCRAGTTSATIQYNYHDPAIFTDDSSRNPTVSRRCVASR
jgi:hypothetical protein